MTLPMAQEDCVTAPVPGTVTIGVLMGGCSRERDISLESGRAVAEALREAGHDVRPADVRPGGVTAALVDGLDVVFLALHGKWGEDGGIQAELEALGVAYTFSRPKVAALAMDKPRAKLRFMEEGIPTPKFLVAEPGCESALGEAASRLGPLLVVKPVSEGSSIGVAMVDSPQALAEAVRAVWSRGDPALVERRVVGREFTVGVLGSQALPAIEIRTPGGWYDYHHKYESDKTEYVFEHGLAAAVESRLVETALQAHCALGCRDLSRVDIMLTPEGEPQVLEINTIPGFTSHSLVPKAAARAGLPFPKLCERLVAMVLRRSRRRSARGSGRS